MANKDKLLENAQKFLSKGQVAKAVSEYQKLIEAFPKDVRNRQKLAELLGRDKRNDEALTEYEAVAKYYTDTGFYLKAIAVFKQMQKLDAARVDLYLRLAELNEKQGLVGNALSEYRNLVAFYDKNAMHSESISILGKMVALDPENLNFPAKIAECYKATGQAEQAYETFEAIIARLAEKQEHLKIIKLYEHFLDICPEGSAARLPLGKALLLSGACDKAILVFKSLLKQAPEDPQILRLLTDAHVAADDYTNARITLKHLLKQAPENLALHEYYLRICLDSGESELARDRLDEWKDAFFQAGHVKSLLGFYQELKTALPDDETVSAALALIYEVAGVDEPQLTEKPTRAAHGAFETANDAVLDVAIDDVETFEMVGEGIDHDIEVPPLEPFLSSRSKPTGASLELDLDLDLDLGEEQVAPEVEVAGDFEMEAEAVEEEQADSVFEAADDDIEASLEMEFDLDSLTGLDLEFDIEIAEEESAEKESAEEEIAEEEIAEDSAEFAAELASFLEDDVLEEHGTLDGFIEAESLEQLEELDEVEELEDLEDLEELEELEVLEAAEVMEEDELTAGSLATPVGSNGFVATLNVEAELEEAEYYLQQGLYDDAERVLQTLLEYRPELVVLQEKMAEIQERRQAAAAEPEVSGFFDLMADLQDAELLDATDFLDVLDGGAAQDAELTQKLATELDSTDTESHFNLGIAYKEMGLYEDAIAEFEKASADRARLIDCITLTGQCHMESGATDVALEIFKKGLAQEGLNEAGSKSLNFEVGLLYQMTGRLLEALESFQLVAEKDSFFRDVGERIKTLRRELGLDEDSGDDGPQGNRDRVSYV